MKEILKCGATGIFLNDLMKSNPTDSTNNLFQHDTGFNISNISINSNQYYSSTTNQLLLNSYSSLYLSFINDVGVNIGTEYAESTVFTREIEDKSIEYSTPNHTQLPIYFSSNTIRIPTKVEYTIRRITHKDRLKAIHKDPEVAKELCLLFLTQLTTTYFDTLEGKDGWRALKAEYLRDLLHNDPMTYKNVIKALIQPLRDGQILECDNVYIRGEKAYNYRLGAPFIGKGILPYILHTEEVIRLYEKHQMKRYHEATKNPICANLIEFYKQIKLPTIEQIMDEARYLVESDHKTKKGKKLTFLNKKPRTYFKEPEKRSFVEDSIQLFAHLTEDGLMIPVRGSERSGGRVVDSITLMPSWIRNTLTIDGERVVECDYSCLHPNIALSLYGGNQEYLSHSDVAEALDIDLKEVKTEHLSFFNKEYWQMKTSPLYSYYWKTEKAMLDSIIVNLRLSTYSLQSKG